MAKFAEDNGIEYQLFSDYDSAVIKEFGILNTLIGEEEEIIDRTSGRTYHGLPFPGVYVTDESGVVTEKFFYRHYATRASAGSIMNSALGEVLMPKQSPSQAVSKSDINITAFLADESLKFEYRSVLYARLELGEGMHVYGGDLPDGYVATTVSVPDTKGLRIGEIAYPETTPKVFDALGVTLNVYKGVVDIAIPISLTAEVMNWPNPNKPKEIDIPIQVNYQLCSESVCYPPKTETVTVNVPVEMLHMPGMKRQ